MSDHSFGERVVVVTGSSTGIGRAIATRFAALGDKVVLHGRTMSRELEQTHSSISEAGGVAAIVTSDYSEESFVDGFVDQVISRFGTPDVWINNAGGDVLTGGGSEMSLSEKLEFLWRVDVRSTLLLSRAVGNLMFEAAETVEPRLRPSLINVGWDQAWQGMAGESGELFATTKGSIMSMTLSLARSLAPRVRVNCIAPGWIRTEWGENAPEAWARRAVSESLMQRWGEPDDIAGAAVFLSSSDASFISGQILNVNGGFRTSSE